jgi:hypothetical protein
MKVMSGLSSLTGEIAQAEDAVSEKYHWEIE